MIKKEQETFDKKKKARFPCPIIPESFLVIPNLDEKDKENAVVRLVAYKHQLDDIIKVMRKNGFAARTFIYNQEKWQEEKKQREILR